MVATADTAKLSAVRSYFHLQAQSLKDSMLDKCECPPELLSISFIGPVNILFKILFYVLSLTQSVYNKDPFKGSIYKIYIKQLIKHR